MPIDPHTSFRSCLRGSYSSNCSSKSLNQAIMHMRNVTKSCLRNLAVHSTSRADARVLFVEKIIGMLCVLIVVVVCVSSLCVCVFACTALFLFPSQMINCLCTRV